MSTKNKQDGIRSRIKNILSTLSPGFTTYLMYLYNFKRLPDFDNPKDINLNLPIAFYKHGYLQ